jgi:Type III restriction enzyme, res subunit
MSFQPRKWQQDCLERFQQKLTEGSTSFILEACPGAGKSAMAAWMAKTLLDVNNDYKVDHVLVLVPWVSIQGDTHKGMGTSDFPFQIIFVSFDGSIALSFS